MTRRVGRSYTYHAGTTGNLKQEDYFFLQAWETDTEG